MKGLSIVVMLFCASLFLKREIINQKKNSPCGEFYFENKKNYSLKDALDPPERNIVDILLF